MYKGGCLCGKVVYEISSGINDIVYCHCSLCRKAQGSAFATNGNVDAQHFHFISGEDELTAYQASPQHTKFFCKHCGSPIISTNTELPDIVRVRIGTIETAINEKPIAHIFTSSKACWEEIGGDLPQYEGYINTEST